MIKENARGMQDDTISRQAAIDAMAELQGRASSKGELTGISKAWKRIKQLPPIQPEIVRCGECLYRKICSWEKQGAKFCSFAERREVTT